MSGAASFPDWLRSRSSSSPDRAAFSADGQRWSYAELDAAVTTLARKLASHGVREGDRVAALLHNQPLAAMLPHAMLRLGATLVPLNVRLTSREIAWQLSNVAARFVIVEESTIDLIPESERVVTAKEITDTEEADTGLRLDHPGDATLAIIHTSGTTGNPKGAMLSVSNFWWSAIGSALNLGTRDDDRWIICLPLFHVGGLSIVMRSAIYGIEATILPEFDAASVNDQIDRGATIISVVAVMLERLIEERKAQPYPTTLRCVLLGGGPASTSLLEKCAALRIPAVQTYGLTEACSQVATLSPDQARTRPGSVGTPLYPNAVRIQQDEIEVRGPIVMQGYFADDESTSRALSNGWLKTGDAGRIDADGFLYVLDRRDDLIVTGGENVYPAEVEAVLLAHDAVVEAAVIGNPDETWGQRIVAYIRTSAPLDAEALGTHCRALLAGYKVPKEFQFVTTPLPRTASGKIRRADLRSASLPRASLRGW